MLKPIVDKFYEEAKIYRDRIVSLEKRVKELEQENAKLMLQSKKKKEVVVIGDSDDDVYAEEALAPASSLAPIKEEKTVVVIENSTTQQEESKQVTVETVKDRKAYLKEYQRNYRKKQKDLTLNL
jgi:hypothetical protein